MAIEPGIAPSTPNNYQSNFFTSSIRYSFNGGLESTSDFQLDGVSLLNQSDIPGIMGLTMLPSVDAVDETRGLLTEVPAPAAGPAEDPVSLNYFAYNFIKIHTSLRMSPPMAAASPRACLTCRIWSPCWWSRNRKKPHRAARMRP
jgi:hypothetical protein